MRQQSKRNNYPQHRQDMGNEHLGYNEARYSGSAYNQDRNQSKNDWDDHEQPHDPQYPNNEPAYYRQDQYRPGHQPGNNFNDHNDHGYTHNQRSNRDYDSPRPGNHNRENNYRNSQEDINADRRIAGSRNYMREEHAYGQSNDSMYEEQRGNRQGRQNYQDDYNYNNNAQYPYRGDLKAYDTNFDNPENFRKQKRRGFGSRYQR